jgi:uncharacterized protein
MKIQRVIKNTEKFVKARLAGEGTGHDWWHIERVRNNARLVCKSEKADFFIVELAVLLHDVGDRKVIQQDEDDHSIAESFLKTQGISDEVLEQVMYIIKNISFSKSLDRRKASASAEFYVVQDADRLDAMGAIGIARAFAFGGSKSRPLYDPQQKAGIARSAKGYKQIKSSSLHHFEEKLFLLRDLMNTRAAIKIATRRHKYMKAYVRQFLLEWSGKR